jgi:hypothetical protein
MLAMPWSGQPPPTLAWFPGNQTCLRSVVRWFAGRRSHTAAPKGGRVSSRARAWKACSIRWDRLVS